MMKRWMMPKRAMAAMLAVCVVLMVGVRAQAQAVLEMLPEQTEVAIIIPDMAGLSQKLANLNAALGMVAPWMADTLGEVKRSAGMNNGVNDAGSMVLILNNLADMAQLDEPPFLLLVPVSDYNAFLGNFNAQPVEGGLTPVTMPQGQTAFARQVDQYAVLGANEALVTAFKPAQKAAVIQKRAGKLAGMALKNSDFIVMADLAVLAPKLGPKLEEGMNMAIEEMKNDPQALAGSPVDPIAMLNMYRQGMQSFLNSGEMVVMGLDFSEMGIGLSYAAQFKPGSDVARLMQPSKTTAAAHLKGVANQPYLFAVSQDFQSIDIKKLIDNVMPMVRKDNPQMASLIDAAMPLMTLAQGSAGAYYPGQLNLAGSLFNSANVVAVEDTAAYVKAYQDFLTKMRETKIPIQLPAGPDGQQQPPVEVAFVTQYNTNTTTVDGVSIDQYEMRYDLPPELLAQINPQLMMLTGMAAQRGYVAQVNGKVIITSTADLPTLTQSIAAAKNGQGLEANAGITQVREHLTPDAAFEAYVNVGTISSTLINFAAMMGQDVGIQVPENMPPIGYSMSLAGDGAAARTYLPMPVLKFTKDVTIMFAPMVGGMMDQQEGNDGMGGPGAPPR